MEWDGNGIVIFLQLNIFVQKKGSTLFVRKNEKGHRRLNKFFSIGDDAGSDTTYRSKSNKGVFI